MRKACAAPADEDYEMKIECIKRKKTIAYYQNAINHGGQVDQDAMKEYLDKEIGCGRTGRNMMLHRSL